MKTNVLLFMLFMLPSFFATAQDRWVSKLGYGTAQAGTGDIRGHWFLGGMQKQVWKRSGFEVLATGTYIEQTRYWQAGFETFQKSNGVALDARYNLLLNIGPAQFYPAAGPVLRYASEQHMEGLTIFYDDQKGIVEFEPEMRNKNGLQAGFVLALNMDVKATQNLTFGLSGSVQNFHTGQTLAALGVTLKNRKW